jgi:hypothetical protein
MNTTSNTTRSTPSRRNSRPTWGRRLALVGLVGATTVTGVVVSAEMASARTTTDSRDYTIETFRETIKPWDSISIPTMACTGGWLIDHDYSPGRIVPRGVEITGDSGSIGTTITDKLSRSFEQPNNTYLHANYGTNGVAGWSYATNWDPFSSHQLVVKLHCTTDPSRASLVTHVPGFGNG